MSRITVLRTIAAHYHELTDPMQARSKKGSGAKLPLMPQTYTPTVREFERLTSLLRQHGVRYTLTDGRITTLTQLRWHLLAYYIDATTTLQQPAAKPPRNRKGELRRQPTDDHGQPLAHRKIHRHPNARRDLADAALEWIANHWTAPYEPMLPDELLTAPADPP